MSLAKLIRDMSAAGAPAEAIALAVEAIEGAQARLDEKRAVERDRKRRQRDRERDSHGTVTGQSEDIPAAPALSRPPNENNSNPPTHTHPEKNTRARGSRLAEDWQPEALNGQAAQEVAAWPPGALERELARFRDWAASATGPNAVKSNWQAAWRNWIRKAQDDGRYGKQQRHSFSGQGSTRDLGMEVARELAEHRTGGGIVDIVPRLSAPGRTFG